MSLLVDTGFLYALADRSDAWHARVAAYLTEHPQTLLAPVTILPEVAYLLRERLGPKAEQALVQAVKRGEIAVEELRRSDWPRLERVMEDYDALGFVDASLVAIAERLKTTTLATTDRRHFSVLKPTHAPAFTLVP